ncbi:MAG: 3'-5' exonuclease [Gammaproteobacteria bacterium]
MAVFVFDIETVPDCELGRKLLKLQDVTDEEVANALFAWRMQTHQTSFLPHYLQKVVAISCVMKNADKLTVWSLGEETSPESELIERFFAGLDRFIPTLVSWNGTGFDLPVLHYRALKHGIAAAQYWEVGEHNNQFKYNNYLNRYHYRHIDLMDVLSGYTPRASAPLDHIALMLGLPGKMGMNGSEVWGAYQAGKISEIRDYCETDVLNTYLTYLAFERMRGELTEDALNREHALVRETLQLSTKPYAQTFLTEWESK